MLTFYVIYFHGMVWVQLSPLMEHRCKSSPNSSDYDMRFDMKHFYPDGSGLLSQDDSAPIYRAHGLTEWFYEDGNDILINTMVFTENRSEPN